MKKIVLIGAIIVGIFYILAFSLTAVFHQEIRGDTTWVEWERECEAYR